MRWARTTLRNSFFGWVANAQPAAPVSPEVRVEAIRHAMLSSLSELSNERDRDLGRRLRATEDISTLWYARSDIMQSLAARLGEAEAKVRMAEITQMFDGLLSPALSATKKKRR